MDLSGYRFVWLVAMFDLPTRTKAERKAYTQFRKRLLNDGFTMMQFSVYMRHCSSEENASVHAKRVEISLPARGEVRLLLITDKQFERMRVFWGRSRKKAEPAPEQLLLF